LRASPPKIGVALANAQIFQARQKLAHFSPLFFGGDVVLINFFRKWALGSAGIAEKFILGFAKIFSGEKNGYAIGNR
jgi:hypothetical protein